MNYKEALILIAEEYLPVGIVLICTSAVVFLFYDSLVYVHESRELRLQAFEHGQAKLNKDGNIEIIPDLIRSEADEKNPIPDKVEPLSRDQLQAMHRERRRYTGLISGLWIFFLLETVVLASFLIFRRLGLIV
ncbi:MAG: hypothetical protein DRN14_08005 [Thermoplasmata archaeon]|nr:MAG: hypothetical protein DRN14_08005 [Thermoplasmata archaeon]